MTHTCLKSPFQGLSEYTIHTSPPYLSPRKGQWPRTAKIQLKRRPPPPPPLSNSHILYVLYVLCVCTQYRYVCFEHSLKVEYVPKKKHSQYEGFMCHSWRLAVAILRILHRPLCPVRQCQTDRADGCNVRDQGRGRVPCLPDTPWGMPCAYRRSILPL